MLQTLGQLIVSGALIIGSWFGYHQPLLGGASIATPATRYESSLAIALSSTQTSTMSLVSGVDGNGQTLSGYTCFTIDSGVANSVEDVCGTASGTTVTNLQRGMLSNGITSSSTLAKAHRVGANVKITDASYLGQFKGYLNGEQSLPNPLNYATSVTNASLTTSAYNIATVGYVNSTSFAGAPNGNSSTKGIYQEATNAQLASGTTSGSTGADLALTTNVIATSSKPNSVVVTGNSNTIDPSFFQTSTNYNLSNQTFTSTTLSSTVTFKNVTSSLLSTSATGSVIGIGGSLPTGTLLTFQNGGWGSGLAYTTSNVSTTVGSASTSIFTANFPGNATGTSIIYFYTTITIPSPNTNKNTTNTIALVGGGTSSTLFTWSNNWTGAFTNTFSVWGRIWLTGSTVNEIAEYYNLGCTAGSCTPSGYTSNVQTLNLGSSPSLQFFQTANNGVSYTLNATTTIEMFQ